MRTALMCVPNLLGKARPALPLLAWFLLTVLAGMSACGAAQQGQPTISARADKPDTQIAVDANPGHAIVQITSPSGIGRADFSITSGPVPKQVVFQLHLKGLEQFTLSYAQTTVTGSLSSSQGNEIRESVQLPASESGSEQPLSADSAYWMDIQVVAAEGAASTIPLESGYIEITAPRDLAATDQRSFSITWIDFFR